MSHTILLVEDDPSLQYSISLALETAGYDVLTAGTVQAASALCGQADLLLLDVMLPDESGLAFCKRLRQTSSKPVLFLTSCSDEADIVRGLDCGGDDYITKPFPTQNYFLSLLQ
ncbi:MAG: response regulator [Oscillospiraceae bacterium]|nr:response regulator [Oscillospiraceae bacterium]